MWTVIGADQYMRTCEGDRRGLCHVWQVVFHMMRRPCHLSMIPMFGLHTLVKVNILLMKRFFACLHLYGLCV